MRAFGRMPLQKQEHAGKKGTRGTQDNAMVRQAEKNGEKRNSHPLETCADRRTCREAIKFIDCLPTHSIGLRFSTHF